MMEIVNLFRESGTLDELGIGTIRDTLAEHFFPGINTIQTRARYFLFVPWIYEQMEAERIDGAMAGREAARRQAALAEALKKGGERDGLIGIEAGINLQRPPSAIYWGGLGRWGIRSAKGSLEDYHRSLGAHGPHERRARIADGGELIDEARRNWHPSVPPAPADLMSATSFSLTSTEADFLHERIRHATAGSLLAAVVGLASEKIRAAQSYAWEIAGAETLEPSLVEDLRHARNFSRLLEGAHLLYHLMLSEASVARNRPNAPKWVEGYAAQLEQWAYETHGQLDELRDWGGASFISRVQALDPGLPSRATNFVRAWMILALQDPRAIRSSSAARALVRDREHQTKTTLARLTNPKVLARYEGRPGGSYRLNFRWAGARQIVLDILEGRALPAEIP